MISSIVGIIKMLIALSPFILLCIRSRQVNLPKVERSKQVLMPVVTVIYVIITALLMNQINTGLLKFMRKLPKMIPIASVSKIVESIIKGLKLEFWIFFISNTVIILAYLAIKRIVLSIMRAAIKPEGAIHSRISGIFYQYYTEKNIWCINNEYVQARTMFKTFYYTSVVLSAILMMASKKYYFNGLFKTIFYPVFGILVVGELYFYLDGLTKEEYAQDILGEDEDASLVVNYSLLRKFLRSLFGDKLLAENTGINNSLAYDVTTDEMIRNLEENEDPTISSFAAYYRALNSKGVPIDHNYLYSSLDLMSGKSILFNNPFYKDLIPYAFYPMNRVLLSHRKVLVVLGRHAIEEDVAKWIEDGIEAVTNIPFMWKVGVLSDSNSDLDIGIVTRSDVYNIKLHNSNDEFLGQVGYVVILEPSRLIATAQIGLNLLVKKCRGTQNNDITYCLCDKNCDGLVDAMSHILMTNLTEVSATKKHSGTSSYMCWEADEEYLHHRIVPNISRYLGVGTELSFAGLKNQVSKTKWYAGEAFPVVDMHWISGQYYYDLTKYAGIPSTPEAMNERFETTPNFWSAGVQENAYLTVEDESYNMFEILRDFSTRASEHGFINVISSEYLLKDYMSENASIFEADPKAIPYIVADYTRSNRNTVLRMILMMSTFKVPVEVLEKEFAILGIKVYNLKEQLWYEIYNCYATTTDIAELPKDYKEAVCAAAQKTLPIEGVDIGSDIIRIVDKYDLKKGGLETVCYIEDQTFLTLCVSELKSASYITEDEQGDQNYLGTELSGHIYQKYLPGQFFTFGGKYYEMQSLTADGQVLVRRAADHISGRPSYRQIRNYVIHNTKVFNKIGAQQNIAGMKVSREFADITVHTPGYYRMDKYNDFVGARKVLFEGEGSQIPDRKYCNKEILRIELPEFEGKLNENVKYTITLLLNEIFKTIFAENQPYISAVTAHTRQESNPLTYSLAGEGYEVNENSIYIIEDSQLDLGLTVAVERNLERIFKIVHDYLDWHAQALEDSLNPPPEPEPVVPVEISDEPVVPEKKEGIFRKLGKKIKKVVDKIKGWFKKKPKGEEAPESETEEAPATGAEGKENPTAETEGENTPAESEGEKTPTAETEGENAPAGEGEETPKAEGGEETKEEPKKKKGLFGWLKGKKKEKPVEEAAPEETEEKPAEEKPVEEAAPEEAAPEEAEEKPAEEAAPEEVAPKKTQKKPAKEKTSKEKKDKTNGPGAEEITYSTENERVTRHGFSTERRPYHERHYMLFGSNEEMACIDLMGALDYLTTMGMHKNALKQAREGKEIAAQMEAAFQPGRNGVRYCDFCGTEIYGVEYETLSDGRDRCMNCGRTAVKTGEEFRKIFEDVKRNMEAFFGISINVGIRVEMVNSKTLHKRLGKTFTPTPKSDGRVLGVAIRDKNGYTLMVENGSPRMASMLTIAHELTHIWQYLNWNDKELQKKYGKHMILEVYEGMAKWVEVQYAYLINEPSTARREEIITAYREDEYGRGFLRYRANYPFSRGTVLKKATPFLDTASPLALEYCGQMTVRMPDMGVEEVEEDAAGKEQNPTGDGTNETPEKETEKVPKEPLKGEINRDPSHVRRYAYELLSDTEKQIYAGVYQAISSFQPEMALQEPYADQDQMKKIVDYVQRDYPELFWFQHGATFYYNVETNLVNKVEFRYCMQEEEAKKRKEEIDREIKPFIETIRSNMSDYEVALRVYENIIKLVDYDTVGLEAHGTAADADKPDDLRSVYGVFVNKKAVCAGYSKATQYLLNMFGIECTYVVSSEHAWNLVNLEGDYYHLDTTWGDGTDTKKDKPQIEEVNYDCFCITTEEVMRLESHTPTEDMPLPECTATKCNYHHRHGLFLENYKIIEVRSVVEKQLADKNMTISMKFGSEEAYQKAKKSLIDDGKMREILQHSNLKSRNRISNKYMYSVKDDRWSIAFYFERM